MNLLFSINQKFIPLWEQCMATILRHGGAAHYDEIGRASCRERV